MACSVACPDAPVLDQMDHVSHEFDMLSCAAGVEPMSVPADLDKFKYLLSGGGQVETTSSVLLSSSRYLNDARLREWVATESLRRNGRDLPSGFGVPQLYVIMQGLTDADKINRLFARVREQNPVIDRWFGDRFVSNYRKDDLKIHPPGSIGRSYFDMLEANNLQVEILPDFVPRSDADYYMLRAQQTHDLEHMLIGLQANAMGEMGTMTLRIASFFKFFGPELAGELSVFSSLLLTSCMNRTFLHYPQCWPAFWDSMVHGTRIGEASGPFFTAKYEDLFHLPVEEVRERVGIRGFERELDTRAVSATWSD
jgi:ubiquinone biosynthesis protein COQ4